MTRKARGSQRAREEAKTPEVRESTAPEQVGAREPEGVREDATPPRVEAAGLEARPAQPEGVEPEVTSGDTASAGRQEPLSAGYREVLGDFLRRQSEKALYDASELSKRFVERGVGPEEIVALHTEMIEDLIRVLPLIERPRAMTISLQFLLEVMITYGISYKEYLDLRLAEATRRIERQMEIDRIRAQEEIRREQEVLKAKEEFLELVTHELRNPLATLAASIEYMLGGLGREDAERRERLLLRMRESVNQLIRMINELLAVSRAEEIERPLRLEPLLLDALVNTAVSQSASAATAKGIDLSAHLAAGEARVVGDQEWLQRAIGNLVTNAVKFTPLGGKAWASTRADRTAGIVEVGDTGPGIAPGDLDRVFDKYYQVQQGDGAGLGLYLARQVVRRHGGDITVESEKGKGTLFRVSLPRA